MIKRILGNIQIPELYTVTMVCSLSTQDILSTKLWFGVIIAQVHDSMGPHANMVQYLNHLSDQVNKAESVL